MAGRDLTITPTNRDRRKSPATCYSADSSTQALPVSPTSSVADTTFEPSIEMMVNDFDDEATLNEEEALANLEAHNPEDEIATLREESDMPIEELLAKYSSMPNIEMASPSSYKRSSTSSNRRLANKRQIIEGDMTPINSSADNDSAGTSGETAPQTDEVINPTEDFTATAECHDEIPDNDEEMLSVLLPEGSKKLHRSHLLDLYPDESFGSSAQLTTTVEDAENFTALKTLFAQAEEEEEEDSDTDSDDTRKTIMVGYDYQAEIPEGLSQYGDVLPYENEDQLIWEPSQVTEREVEEYLTKIQETRSLPTSTEGTTAAVGTESVEVDESLPTTSTLPPTQSTTLQHHVESVVKDNEQALHLLVQCGYDFKEALRRKRLNVPPLSDTMSSWSEEECQKFEEGIQKFGKDFYQIRQNQVRTRTMRELVQFYYLWKKSERRDQCFALNDTIDHMDAFLNEGGDHAGNGNGNGNGNGSCSSHASSCSSNNGHSNGNAKIEEITDKETASTRKSSMKNYSIMTGNNQSGNASGTSRKRGASFGLDEVNEDENIIDSLS